MGSTGRQSDRKDGFLFLGNQLALDFVNTRPVQDGEPVELLSDFAALLRWFEATRLLNSREIAALRQEWDGSVRAQRTTEAIRRLRENLRKQVLAWERGGPVQPAML